MESMLYKAVQKSPLMVSFKVYNYFIPHAMGYLMVVNNPRRHRIRHFVVYNDVFAD